LFIRWVFRMLRNAKISEHSWHQRTMGLWIRENV